jgi:hypothetical protein
MIAASDGYYNARKPKPGSCCLAAPTGSGKTVMAAAAAEALFYGAPERGIDADRMATILWVSDSPSLNEQTKGKFLEATDLSPQQVVTIENSFTGDHKTLEPEHVYFLNRQKLASSAKLAVDGETPSLWSLLEATINSPLVHVYMILDEAHKGLGSNDKTDKDADTIVSQLIDGKNGDCPMPVVVGISATPARFKKAMEGRKNRADYGVVAVKPADVQASGLLKDKIIIQSPEDNSLVFDMYLNDACHMLDESNTAWEHYCKSEGISPIVKPLMIVQVNNNVSEKTLHGLCVKINELLPWLDRSWSYAHVMSGMGDLQLGQYIVRKENPEDVQRKHEIQVLFAKEAISTGWDCPRAEVIFSMRRHSDHTYIAQLIGRMVRTPLARNVGLETLNSVGCYLPEFNSDALKKVVGYLTEEGSDDFSGISEKSGRTVVTNPVKVEWDASTGLENVFTSITSRTTAHRKTNYIQGAVSYSGVLDDFAIDKDTDLSQRPELTGREKAGEKEELPTEVVAEEETVDDGADGQIALFGSETEASHEKAEQKDEPVRTDPVKAKPEPAKETVEPTTNHAEKTREALVAALLKAIQSYPEEFEKAIYNVRNARSTKTTLRYLDKTSVSSETIIQQVDAYAIAHARDKADAVFTPTVTNEYFRLRRGDGADTNEINIELAAAASMPKVEEAVRNAGRKVVEETERSTERIVAKTSDAVKSTIYATLNRNNLDHTVYLSLPEMDIQDREGARSYPKHVICDPVRKNAWFKLNKTEDKVIRNEIKNPKCIAWFRNPPMGNADKSFAISYREGDSRRSAHPDFIIFEEVHGEPVCSIVDPHGLQDSLSLNRLIGYVRYVEQYGDRWHRIWALAEIDGEMLYLDMKDPETIAAVQTLREATDCYRMVGKPYPWA